MANSAGCAVGPRWYVALSTTDAYVHSVSKCFFCTIEINTKKRIFTIEVRLHKVYINKRHAAV